MITMFALKSITGQNSGMEDAYLVSAGYNVYGQTVTGGVGSGSESTSRFHGPSIDGSEFGYSFDGWGSIIQIWNDSRFGGRCNKYWS